MRHVMVAVGAGYWIAGRRGMLLSVDRAGGSWQPAPAATVRPEGRVPFLRFGLKARLLRVRAWPAPGAMQTADRPRPGSNTEPPGPGLTAGALVLMS